MLIIFLGGLGARLGGAWGVQKRINIINISPVLSTFLEKVAKTGEMLIMLILFGGLLDLGGFPHSP